MKPNEQNQPKEEKLENKENQDNQEKKEDEKEKEKQKQKVSSPKKEEIKENQKEKIKEEKKESTPIKKDIKLNNNNNTDKITKPKAEIKINKPPLQKPSMKKEHENTKQENKNNENKINQMESMKDYYERERIRRIKASLEKYRIKEPEYVPIKPIIKNKKVEKKNVNEHKNKENNINTTEKKIIKTEHKSEKKISNIPSSQNKEKDKNNINNKELLNKKRERDDTEKKEKIEKKDKPISTQKKVIKKPTPIQPKKIIEEDEEEDEEDSDYDLEEEDNSYSEGEESENGEESYSSSSSKKKKKSKLQSHKKITPKKSVKKESGISSTKKVSLKPKGILVNELLKRWWFALPPWPPENFDTSEKLKENKLRLVKISDWKREPKFDKDNFEKCLELPGFKYVYLNNDGKIFDLRPEEGKPSYNNLIKLSDAKLHEYLAKALKGQLEVLEKRNSINEKGLRQELKEKLDKEEKTLARIKQ